MTRRALPLALGAGLLAAAVLLALLAVSLWRWPDAAARDDALLRRAPVPQRAWASGDGLAARVAGASDDVAMRRAIVRFLRGRSGAPGEPKGAAQVVSSAEAQVALALVARSDVPRERRSRALNLVGILLAEDAIFEPLGAPRVARAADFFRRAIRMDPENEDAKSNLELLLGLTAPSSSTGEASGGYGGIGEDGGAAAPESGW